MRCFFFGLLCLLLVDVAISLDKQRDCICRIQSTKRIIGGRKAGPNAFPWQVSLQKIPIKKPASEDDKIYLHFCGGTIINERWVITAAHCVRGLNNTRFRVGYGSNDLVAMHDQNKYAKVEKVILPRPDQNPNDIALVKLKSPLEFGKEVQPACLPDPYPRNYTNPLKISGFGMTKYPIIDRNGNHYNFDSLSRYLKEADTFDVSSYLGKSCSTDEICVQNPKDGSNTCKGDSGGPLHHTEGGRSTVIGATSGAIFPFINPDGSEMFCAGPKAFARISYYMPWIRDETAGHALCV